MEIFLKNYFAFPFESNDNLYTLSDIWYYNLSKKCVLIGFMFDNVRRESGRMLKYRPKWAFFSEYGKSTNPFYGNVSKIIIIFIKGKAKYFFSEKCPANVCG